MADVDKLAVQTTKKLLDLMGVLGHIAVEKSEDAVSLLIDSRDQALLIGKRGDNLRALQYIVNTLVKSETGTNINVVIDVAGYKQAKSDRLGALAREAAQKTLATGRPVYLKPMNAYERRVVHLALSELPDVMTESSGEEPERKIVVKKRP